MPLTCIWGIPIQNDVLKQVLGIMLINDSRSYYFLTFAYMVDYNCEPLPQVLNIMNIFS